MENQLALYLVMVTYGRESSALKIIQDYNRASKPIKNTSFLVVDNYKDSNLFRMLLDQGLINDITYITFPNSNKAAATNFAISNFVKHNHSLIIQIDNDVRFNSDFLKKYYECALKMGSQYYFGGSFRVNLPNSFDGKLIKFYQGSALGKPDGEFLKMKSLMFLGFNYAFFKSQWEKVNGIDERFGPGSKFNLGGDESVFQKKMKYEGLNPFFIENNQVLHKPEIVNYLKKNVLKRNRNNGYTHGFQFVINSNKTLKYDYWRKILGMLKSIVFGIVNKKILDVEFKVQYTIGYFLAFITYLRIPNKESIFSQFKKTTNKHKSRMI